MRFTLTYQGDLPPKANAQQKWLIRRALEPQLRRLWETPPLNDLSKYQDPNYKPDDCYVGQTFGQLEYVPIITEKLSLRAELNIFLLSASLPGGIINQSSDIDNRLKTLLDALSMPSAQQVPNTPDSEPDNRVFCLLEDDKLITRVEVSNDKLLTVDERSREALVIIRVRPIAFRVTLANIGIAV
ncbi:MAG: hypothetical protein ACOY2B_13215 [Pseudomonadota bacterium]